MATERRDYGNPWANAFAPENLRPTTRSQRADSARYAAQGSGRGHRRPQRAGRPGASYGQPDAGTSVANSPQSRGVGWDRDSIEKARAAGLNAASLGATENHPSGDAALDEILAMLAGDGGQDQSASIGSSYDKQIAAYQNAGSEMEALTGQLVGNINSSAAAANEQIGGFFGYAADQANAGRPVIQESGAQAQGNVDSIYDQLSSNLGAIPQQAVDQASAAAGSAIGGSVAGRVAGAVAPFAAAGETSRANTKANLAQHTTAGKDYLSQLAAAAPSEAALSQGAVSGRANMAVTEAEMALSQQRAEIAAQTAALEGAKERAMLEHSADLAGSTMERLMDTASLYDALGADKSGLRESMGLPAAQDGGMGYEDQLDIALKEGRLEQQTSQSTDPLQVGGDSGFNLALQTASPGTQQVGMALRDYAEQSGLGMEDMQALLAPGENETVNSQMRQVLEQILGSFTAYDPEALKGAFRAWYQ